MVADPHLIPQREEAVEKVYHLAWAYLAVVVEVVDHPWNLAVFQVAVEVVAASQHLLLARAKVVEEEEVAVVLPHTSSTSV